MHAAIDEALEVYKGAGIAYEKAGVFKYIKFLKLPQPIVWCIVPFLLADEARPSMYADLENNRKTEVRYINGHIIQLGKKAGVPTPVNQRLVDLVEAAERAAAGSPKVSAASIADGLSLPEESKPFVLHPIAIGLLSVAAAAGLAAVFL